MSDRRAPDSPQEPTSTREDPGTKTGSDPLELIEQCLALFPESDPRQKLLYKLRHAVMLVSSRQPAAWKRNSRKSAKWSPS